MKCPALAVLLALLPLAAPARADTLHMKDGSKLENVRVLKENLTEVEYRVPRVSSPQRVEASKVRAIDYSSAPGEYKDALQHLEEGRLDLAAGYFLSVAEDTEVAPHLRADARVREADALNENGNLAKAIEAYDALLKQFPDTRHLARGLLGRGLALFRKGDIAGAQQAFETLRTEATAKSLGEHYGMEAEFHLLWIQQQQGKAADAIKGFEALLKKAGGQYPTIANKCSVRLGRAKLDAGQVDEARALFEEIIDSRLDMDSRDVAAEAFIGRGRCRFAVAQAAADKADKLRVANDKAKAEAARQDAVDGFKAARLDFLRVVVSYADVQSAQPEAMYWAAQCYLNLGGDDAEREAGRLLKSAERYENSQWGKKAKAEL